MRPTKSTTLDTRRTADADATLPPFFAEMIAELHRYEREFGGVRNFPGRPRIEKKVTRQDFCSMYTDFEYIYLTIVGFAQLHIHCEEIIRRMNGQPFTQNPGVQLLEARCGMTMHG